MTVKDAIAALKEYPEHLRIIDGESGEDIEFEKGKDDDNVDVVEIALV